MEVLIGKLPVLMQVLIGTSASQINEHEGIINGWDNLQETVVCTIKLTGVSWIFQFWEGTSLQSWGNSGLHITKNMK